MKGGSNSILLPLGSQIFHSRELPRTIRPSYYLPAAVEGIRQSHVISFAQYSKKPIKGFLGALRAPTIYLVLLDPRTISRLDSKPMMSEFTSYY